MHKMRRFQLNVMSHSVLPHQHCPPCGIDSRAPMPPTSQQNYGDDNSWSTWSSMDLMNGIPTTHKQFNDKACAGLRQTNTTGAPAPAMITPSIWSNDATPQMPSTSVSLQAAPLSPPTPCNVHIDQKDDLALHFLTKCLMQDLA